ncbi:MAG: signal recognition particle-docking protein FtsY [Corynebacterium sp.]|nr:signal recognition particle-docking protein FtsY [Corynebacterium sp.]
MTTTWIIAIVAIVIALIVLFVVLGLRRRKQKTVSFNAADGEKTKELTQQEKSGNYQAVSGFQFSSGAKKDAEPEVLPGQELGSESTAAQEAVAHDVAAAETAEPAVQRAYPTQSDSVQNTEVEDRPAPDAKAAEENLDESPEPVAEVLEAETSAAGSEPSAEGSDEVAGPEAETVKEDVAHEDDAEVNEPAVSHTEVTELHAEESLPAPAVESFEVDTEEHPEPVAETLEAETPETASESPAEVLDKENAPAHETAVDEPAAKGATVPAEEASAQEVAEPEAAAALVEGVPTAGAIDEIEPAAGRLGKLRGRLSRSNNVFGQAVLGMLTAGDLDEDAWEEIEDQLIAADLGVKITMNVVEELRDMIAERGVQSEDDARAMLREVLIKACKPELDRSINALPYEGKPAVILVVGVNGTGKTTTTGKLARVLVSMGHKVVLGAADTFRAAAADQLETWGRRVGATTVRGAEGADPASVAFDSVAKGIEQQADVVLVDTAGRLHNSANLMDQLGKVKRVVEKKAKVDEVLLVLDATTGQNGMIQARTFAEVVQISGVVLTKLDGSAKGGIVFQVQEELGVPVKLVGLGEGADHLAPFEVESFIDALLQ